MTKREAIEKIRKARFGHIKWKSFANAIHMGIPVSKEALPINETECAFGQWYYGEAQIFSDFESFQSIEEKHRLLHNMYMKIYSVRNEPTKTNIFGSDSKSKKKKQVDLDKLMKELENISELLINDLKTFELKLKSMSDSVFAELN